MRPYYEDTKSGITIYNADCREVLPTIPAGSVDLVFTSPPYNLGNTTGGGFPNKRLGHYSAESGFGKARGGMGKWASAALANGYSDHSDSMPHEEYVDWQKSVLSLCWNLLSATGAIFYNHKSRIFSGELVTPLEYNPSLPVRQIIVWARAGGINFSPAFYVPTHEWVVVFAKPDFRLSSKGASGVGDVWYIPQESNPHHPAPFPLALPMRALETTTALVILDPFCGIGTTLLAAKRLGRHAAGIEISEAYCEIAVKRLQQEVFDFAPPKPEAVQGLLLDDAPERGAA